MTQVIEEAVKKVLEESKPRNFTQSIDVVITINDLDVNKPENRLDEEVLLPNGRGKDVKIAFIAEGELAYQAEKAGADLVIDKEQLEAYGKNRAEAKKVANSLSLSCSFILPHISSIDFAWNCGFTRFHLKNPHGANISSVMVGTAG